MDNWYLAMCQRKNFERVVCRISKLEIECYFPLETRIIHRKDCGGSRVSQKPLLPGYLFVRFDPEIIHTSKMTSIPGFYSFVRFGEFPCVVPDKIIKTLKFVRLLRIDPDCVECTNLSPSLLSAIQKIYTVFSSFERQAEFMCFLAKNEDVRRELLNNDSGVYTQFLGCSS